MTRGMDEAVLFVQKMYAVGGIIALAIVAIIAAGVYFYVKGA